eukprot:1623669-Rhodomonas_salina.2
MNEIFGFQLEPQYQPGPYEWNERYCPGSPFEGVCASERKRERESKRAREQEREKERGRGRTDGVW